MKGSMLKRLYWTISVTLFITIVIALIFGRLYVQQYYIQMKVDELLPMVERISEEISQTGTSDGMFYPVDFILKAFDPFKNEMDVFQSTLVLPDQQTTHSAFLTNSQIKTALSPYLDRALMGNVVREIADLEGMAGTSVILGVPIKRDDGQCL